LVAALRRRLPGVAIDALGGPRIAAAGATVRYPSERYTVLGFAEVLSKLPAHWALLRRLRRDFRARRYDLLVALDYPGFNVRLAEAARGQGVKVLYYIAPKYWASGARRSRRLARAIDRLAVVFPFERDFFARFGVAAEYVGHPLLDRGPPPLREAAREALGTAPEQRLLALFPGSRPQEIARLWPPFRAAARLLLGRGSCERVVVAAVAGGSYPDAGGLLLRYDDPATILAAADAALVKSGTATLEAALADVPLAVAYRLHWFTAWLARRLLTVPWISLVNLLAEAPVVEELLQDEVRAERLAAALEPLLARPSPAAARQREAFAGVRARLGGPGAAARTAELAADLLR
jgi:lipid-A-disaccharide synthase